MNTKVKTARPKAKTFRMVLEVLEERRKKDPREWRQESQFICHVIGHLTNRKHITGAEDARAVAYIERMLAPNKTLANWVARQGYIEVYDSMGKLNDHRIEWVKHIIKELS